MVLSKSKVLIVSNVMWLLDAIPSAKWKLISEGGVPMCWINRKWLWKNTTPRAINGFENFQPIIIQYEWLRNNHMTTVFKWQYTTEYSPIQTVWPFVFRPKLFFLSWNFSLYRPLVFLLYIQISPLSLWWCWLLSPTSSLKDISLYFAIMIMRVNLKKELVHHFLSIQAVRLSARVDREADWADTRAAECRGHGVKEKKILRRCVSPGTLFWGGWC